MRDARAGNIEQAPPEATVCTPTLASSACATAPACSLVWLAVETIVPAVRSSFVDAVASAPGHDEKNPIAGRAQPGELIWRGIAQ
jgi:hypothetical protein